MLFYVNRSVYEVMWIIIVGLAGCIWIYGTCELRVGSLSLQTHTQNLLYLLLSHCNIGCTIVPKCYVICSLSVLFEFIKPHPLLSSDVSEHSISSVFGVSVCIVNVSINI